MEKDAHIQQYLDVLRRRKFQFVVPGVLVFMLVVIIAMNLPPVYKATTTIQIEAQEIPWDLVRTTVTGYADQRIQNISNVVLSHANLQEVIKRFDLYADLQHKLPLEDITEKMQTHIVVANQTAEVRDDKSGRFVKATVSFTLTFDSKEQDKVAPVANFLASLFLEENLRDRKAQARTAAEFFENERAGLRSEILEIEAQLAAFKEKHINELPELMQLNLRTIERLKGQIDTAKKEINDLITRKISLEQKLATLQPNLHRISRNARVLLTPEQDLEVLRSQYLSLSASLSEQHPDMISLKKKLAAMEKELSTLEDLRKLRRQLLDKERQLSVVSKKYSEQHPDVVRLKKEVSRLREEIQKSSAKQIVLKLPDEKPDNPEYINIQHQIASNQMQVKTAQKDLKLLIQRREDYRRRVENTPRVEQKYLDLQRKYADVKARYQEIMDRLLAAKEARGLEDSDMGEKFTLLERAETPEKPYKPNRLALLFLGMMLAVGSGFSFGAVAEYMDHSVHQADELAKLSGHTVLAVIPYRETSADRDMKRRRRFVYAGSTVVMVVIGIAVMHFLFKPLDMVWGQIIHNLSTTF